MKLSIIVPLFNEEKTIKKVLLSLSKLKITGVTIEVIVVDDGSTDTSAKIVKEFRLRSLKRYYHKLNCGKGEAVKTGLAHATGTYILIQDADLEYNTQQITTLCEPILKKCAQIVYGTRLNRLPRLTRDERTPRFFIHYLGNRALSLITSLLYGQFMTDIETGYKLFPKDVVEKMALTSRGFEFEAEITAKFLKNGYHILEVPIVTTPRNYSEGKKLQTVRDGSLALWTLIKYRFIS